MNRATMCTLMFALVALGTGSAAGKEPAGSVAEVAWGKAVGGKGSDEGRAVAVDGKGNILVTGRVRDEADFGGGPLKTASRGTGAFLACYGPGGEHRWSKVFGGGRTTGFAVAADAEGNVALTGMNGGDLTIDGHALPRPTNLDVFIARFAPDGKHLWSRGFGGDGDDVGCAIACDGDGNVLVAGTYLGAVSVGGPALPDTDSIDIFLAKYAAADGKLLWSRSFGGPGSDGMTRGGHYLSLALTKDGDILLTGSFGETVSFGETKLTSKGESDGFVARLSPDGKPAWAVAFGGPQDDVPQGIVGDGEGGVLVCGGFQATVDFGGGPLKSAAQNDVFVLALTADGKHAWSRRYGAGVVRTGPMAHMRFPTQPEHAVGLAVGEEGHIILAGPFGPACDLGAGALEPDGRMDCFLLTLAPDGKPVRSHRLGGPGRELPRALALLPGGDVVLTGTTEKTWSAGDGIEIRSAGRADVLLIRAKP